MKAIGPESDYDNRVSPLINELMTLAKSVSPPIPFAACSTFVSSESDEKEGSVSSAYATQKGTTPRMQRILSIAMNRGLPPFSLMATMMMGKMNNKRELDKGWYRATKKHHDVMKKMDVILKQVEELVDQGEEYIFPTAIVVQTPQKGTYRVIGSYPSKEYDGIQFMRVIASQGMSTDAVSTLLGPTPDPGIMRLHKMLKKAK